MRILASRVRSLVPVLSLLMLGSSPGTEPVRVATGIYDAAMANETSGDNWLAFGRTYSEQQFSTLNQVNATNVVELGVHWYLGLPHDRGLVSAPPVVDGILYFIGSMNQVWAVDAPRISTVDFPWRANSRVHYFGRTQHELQGTITAGRRLAVGVNVRAS